MTDRLEGERYISRMPKQLTARVSLFMYVRTHSQLEYYFNLSETHRAANQTGLCDSSDSAREDNVVEIHPIARTSSAQGPI
jgi:hypothetical protein